MADEWAAAHHTSKAQKASVEANKRRRLAKTADPALAITSSLVVPAPILQNCLADLETAGNPLQHCIGSVCLQVQKYKETKELKRTVVHEFLQEPVARGLHYATVSCQASTLGVKDHIVVQQSRRHYASSLAVDGFVRACVLAGMTSNTTYSFLQNIEGLSYDATPLHLKPLPAVHKKQSNIKSTELCLTSSAFEGALPVGSMAISCNVLQTKTEFGWLFSKDGPERKEYLMIYGHTLSHLQNVVSNRASAMMTAMAEQALLPEASHSAESCSRVVAIDRHPSNIVVERRSLRRRRRTKNKKWQSYLKTCAQHKLGCVRWQATKPFELVLTGLINVTRSLNSFTYINGFRKDFYQVAYDNCRVVYGYAPAANRARNRNILKWFLVKGPNTMAQRVLLELLAEGDWNNDKEYLIYLPPGTVCDEDKMRRQFASGMTEALCSRRWRMYIRKKHGGAEEAVCDIALPLIVHGIIVPAYNRFCLRHNPKVNNAKNDGDDDDGHLPAILENGDPALPYAYGEAELPVKFEFDRAAWAAQNDRFRTKGQTFLSCEDPRPVASTICLRMILACVQCMEKEEFWVGSRRWNMLEEAKAAAADNSQEGFKLNRDYQALLHARGEIESKGIFKMHLLLFDTRLWQFIPEQDLTNQLKVQTFLGLTSAEASTERHMGVPHRRIDSRILLILEQPWLIESIMDIPECLHSAWSWDFITKNDLCTEEAKMKLLLHCIMLHCNTNELEVENAQLRLGGFSII